MLDAYTSTMCLKSWGHTTYAWALIEMSPKKALLDSLVKVAAPTQESYDAFVEVTSKPRHTDGVRSTKPQPNYFYHVVSKPVYVNDEASSQPKGNKEASSQPKSNLRKKMGIPWMSWLMKHGRREDMGQATDGWEHENAINDNG
nr:hypothetical protein [Tanacetum cinerariifolium]